MAESNKMREMPVNKLMVQMGIPMILSMALQAVYNIVDSVPWCDYLCGMSVIWYLWSESIHLITDH